MDVTKTTSDQSRIKTRLFVLSDTHGADFAPERKYSGHVDVAIHCGDLTDGSTLHEYRTTLQLLSDIDAPLKLVIAGNHDFTMDTPAFERKVAEASSDIDADEIRKEYGDYGTVRQMFEQASSTGMRLLDEGTHKFVLENGALLTVYASPFTPSFGDWGFQYRPDQGHTFAIESGVDIVMTHGPPRGIMDYTIARERAGCPELFAAIAQARPQIHCFGHIHEGFGAKLVTWRPQSQQQVNDTLPSHFTAIDNSKSTVLETLSTLKPSQFDTTADTLEAKSRKLEQYIGERCCATSLYPTGGGDDANHLRRGEQTLFINASIASRNAESAAQQFPWVVDVELDIAEGP